MPRLGKIFLPLCLLWMAGTAAAVVLPKRDHVLQKAKELLETWNVSYVYGGTTLGDQRTCEACNACLDLHKSKPKERLIDCPVCSKCSIDCSHYTFEVFKQSGLNATYLTTALMNALSPEELAGRYNLLDIGADMKRAMPGDLLVFNGHVVLLEKRYPDGRGDVIHSTSGRELKGPGNGIQRERRVELANFRGPILRILRHVDLAKEMRDFYIQRRMGATESPSSTKTHE